MNLGKAILSKALVLSIPLSVAVVTVPGDARAQYAIPPPPPDAYVATVAPEYYEGRPVYFYNGNWFYRDHGAWNYYRTEPAYLHGRRAHWAQQPRYHYHRR